MSSTTTSTFCSACGARLGSTDQFCHTCGAAVAHETDASAGDAVPPVARPVVTKPGEEVLDQSIFEKMDRGLDRVDRAVGTLKRVIELIALVVSLLTPVVLWWHDHGSSFGYWFLLTWPLTLASAAVVVVEQRVTKGSGTIFPIAIIMLLVATILGVNLAGTPIDLYAMPTGWLAMTIFLVQGLLHAFGPLAFVLSIVTGVVAGIIFVRASDIAVRRVSKALNQP